ncbi:MAG: hypothetical protein ABIW94_10200 [Gemmatimonadaceae bacterium]
MKASNDSESDARFITMIRRIRAGDHAALAALREARKARQSWTGFETDAHVHEAVEGVSPLHTAFLAARASSIPSTHEGRCERIADILTQALHRSQRRS